MKIGKPREVASGAWRVAMMRQSASDLQKLGHRCLTQMGSAEAAAGDDQNSPIDGMQVLGVLKAKQVFVFKRMQGTGYSGVKNPLIFKDNTRKFHGDAKASVDSVLPKLG